MRTEKLTNRLVRAVLLSLALSSSTMVATASGLPSYVNMASTILPFGSIVLAQAEGTTSTDKFDELLSQLLEDPARFSADIIVDIVRQAIAQNPANVDAIIAAVDSSSNSSITEAVAEGIARVAADYAAAGDTAASSQILAKASLATSTALRQAVRNRTSEIATEMASVTSSLQDEDVVLSSQETPTDTQEGVAFEETETTLSDGEILAGPGPVAPSLSNATGASGDSGGFTVPSGRAISPQPTVGTTNPPVTVTPPQGGVPASPA
jgi:hypothetical protein